MVRRHHVIFQVAPRFRAEIAGPYIGPGAALGFGVAGRLAGLARRTGRYLEIAIVAAGTINGELPHGVARLDDAGAMNAGCGGAVLHPRRHLALEPAQPRRKWTDVRELASMRRGASCRERPPRFDAPSPASGCPGPDAPLALLESGLLMLTCQLE